MNNLFRKMFPSEIREELTKTSKNNIGFYILKTVTQLLTKQPDIDCSKFLALKMQLNGIYKCLPGFLIEVHDFQIARQGSKYQSSQNVPTNIYWSDQTLKVNHNTRITLGVRLIYLFQLPKVHKQLHIVELYHIICQLISPWFTHLSVLLYRVSNLPKDMISMQNREYQLRCWYPLTISWGLLHINTYLWYIIKNLSYRYFHPRPR